MVINFNICCGYIYMDKNITVILCSIYFYMNINMNANNVMLQLHLYEYKCNCNNFYIEIIFIWTYT